MRIGILIKDFHKLANWELRIINEIKNNKDLELALLIKDGRIVNKKSKSNVGKIINILNSKNIISRLLFQLQCFIEKKIFKKRNTVDKDSVIDYLNKIETIKVSPTRRGFLDIFSDDDSQKIKNYDLDIILRHEFNIIRGPILTSSKYGIWSYHHADNSINRGGPAGFWEVLFKHSSIGVTLQQLTPELDGGLVIDKAFFNVHWSYIQTNRLVLEASVSLLFKNIRQLQLGNYSPKKSLVYYNELFKAPNIKMTLKYILSFYINFFKVMIKNLNTKVLNIKYNRWTLFIGEGDFLNSTLFRLKPLLLPKNEFWADPFITNFKNDEYIFFENYDYILKKGKISCGLIEDNKLINIIDVLEKDYHLSYPYIFKENNELFMMPETSGNNRLEIYKCVSFPDEWILYTTAFEDEKVADAFFYNDANNDKWLFLNKKIDANVNMANELYIYKVDSIQLKEIKPHLQNPVIIDSRKARNGGAIFEYENKIYRPSQANINGIYGYGLNINRIEKLTLEEYIEKDIIMVEPNFYKDLSAIHHLHQSNGRFVIDAAHRKG